MSKLELSRCKLSWRSLHDQENNLQIVRRFQKHRKAEKAAVWMLMWERFDSDVTKKLFCWNIFSFSAIEVSANRVCLTVWDRSCWRQKLWEICKLSHWHQILNLLWPKFKQFTFSSYKTQTVFSCDKIFEFNKPLWNVSVFKHPKIRHFQASFAKTSLYHPWRHLQIFLQPAIFFQRRKKTPKKHNCWV